SSITSAPTTWDEQGAAGFIPPPIAVVGLLARVGPGGFGGTGPPLKFDEVMQAIDDTYDYTPKPFKNGDVTNPAGTNAGSCKLLSLGILHGLPPASLLALF
ncbi:type iii effector protein, partial [Nannochloropsis gaditana CCMP526]